MNVDDVYGTLYRYDIGKNIFVDVCFWKMKNYTILISPQDGVVDPAGFCTALTRAATRAGAKVIEDCVVTGIDTDTSLFGSRQVSAVHTDKGTIKTKCVVNCTGKYPQTNLCTNNYY